MIGETDLNHFKLVSDKMDVSEVYLGHVKMEFVFSKAHYTATCTEAFPFNPFDKVICELLTVESELSFNEIGDILGLNVFDSESPKRYLDLAEKEILLDALRELASEDYKMIEGGDINFTKCSLTQIGREYAKKKNKYRITKNKPFSLYFDHTTGNHQLAKTHYEFVSGTNRKDDYLINVSDELALKEIAAVQTPDIYNPEKQYSFTNALLGSQKSMSCFLDVAITYNVTSKSHQFYCIDSSNERVHETFSEWINNSADRRTDLLRQLPGLNPKSVTHEQNLVNIYSDQLTTIDDWSNVNEAIPQLMEKEFIDDTLFFSKFHELIRASDKTQLYVCFPTISERIFGGISAILQKTENEDSTFYFVLPLQLNKKLEAVINQLKAISSSEANLYIIQQDVSSFTLLCKTDTRPFYTRLETGWIEKNAKGYVHRLNWDERADKFESHFLAKFSDELALSLCAEVNEFIDDGRNQTFSKTSWERLSFFETKLKRLSVAGNHTKTLAMTLGLIENYGTKRSAELEKILIAQLDEIINQLSAITEDQSLLEIQKTLSEVKSQIIAPLTSVSRSAHNTEKLFLKKKEELEEAKKVYYLIIDTNGFINDPEIFEKIATKNKIVVAARVLDELDSLKTKPNLKKIASKAIREIFANRNKNIHRAKANLKLLPPDFNKRSADNIILATALIYKDRNGVLISDDKGLLEKAKNVEMATLTYSEFLVKMTKPNN